MSGPVPGTPSLLRAINDRAALRLLLERGPLTRPELGALTGLSKPTASQLLARLREAGLVVLDGVREGLPGRTAEVYRINPEAAYAAAMDVTSARIAVRVADLTGTVVGEHVLESPGGDLIGGLRAALAGARPPAPPCHLVIGVQAAVDPTTGRLGYATAEEMPGWHIDDLVAELSRGLGVPVSVENNVNLVALAERAHGVARETPDFVLLWADQGIGSAIVLGGRLHRGATGGAGEVGYMPAPGAPTARDRGPYADHGFQALSGGAAILRILHGHGIPGAGFAEAMTNAAHAAAATGPAGAIGDVAAVAAVGALREVAGRLAVGLAAITSVMDPALVVLTGAVPLSGGELLRRLVEEELHALTISRPPVRLSRVAGNAVLVGALDLALATVRDAVLDSAGVRR